SVSAPSCPIPPLLFFHASPHHRDLHSFPTRRSSDLRATSKHFPAADTGLFPPWTRLGFRRSPRHKPSERSRRRHRQGEPEFAYRSEEHTSELQSRSDLVCRLLLEKKKKKQQQKDFVM